MQEEIWKPIEGYEKYQVSNFGRVKSFVRYPEGKILKPALRGGYLFVALSKDGKKKSFRVHRLVALNFIDNPNSKREVNHINGIKTDNRVSNLEWATNAENVQHAYDTGLAKSGEEHGRAKLTAAQVEEIRNSNLTGRELAKIFGVDPVTISKIQRGKTYKDVDGTIRQEDRRRKLTDTQAEYVRDNPDGLTGNELAEKFNVDATTISLIQLGKTYKNAGGSVRTEHALRKLNEVQRAQIRSKYAAGGKVIDLAAEYGVGKTAISKITKLARI